MPFAREDLDSNCSQVSRVLNWLSAGCRTFVSMLGEDAILAVKGVESQSAYKRTEAQCSFMTYKGQPATFL